MKKFLLFTFAIMSLSLFADFLAVPDSVYIHYTNLWFLGATNISSEDVVITGFETNGTGWLDVYIADESLPYTLTPNSTVTIDLFVYSLLSRDKNSQDIIEKAVIQTDHGNISIPVTIDYLLTDTDEINNDQFKYELSNYPNPFNPTTTFSFNLKETSDAEIIIYNLIGQKVKSLKRSNLSSGSQNIKWNGLDNQNNEVSSGVYMYQLKVNNEVIKMNKCILMK